MTPPDRPPLKLAGGILAVLGLFTHGSTCPFAVVLGLEWMADRRRCPHAPAVDRLCVTLGGLLSAYWAMMSATYLPFLVPALAPAVIAYWTAFGGWLVWRMFTRWRNIAAARRRHRLP